MNWLKECVDFYLSNWLGISIISSVSAIIGGIIMWFAKTRKYWIEGTEAKRRVEKMEMDKWLEDQISELYSATLKFYREGKSNAHGRLMVDQQEIRRMFFKEPISLLDETIISGCWKKMLENKNAIQDSLGNFYFVGG